MSSAPVVDVQLHLAPTPGDLAPHCELPWRKVLTEPGNIPPWSSSGAIHPYFGTRPVPPAPARTPAELAEQLAALGVDLAILMPGPLVKLGVLPTAAYQAALARAYNRWLAEAWLGRVPGVYGAVLVAPREPEQMAREVEAYAKDERIKAVVLPTACVDPLWGDRRYDPIYAAATAASLPVILHGVADNTLPGAPHLITQLHNEFEQLALSHPLIAMAHLLSIVGTGALARFPSLKVVFLEAGISWLPHLMLRMDKEYNENRRDVPFYTDRVSHWVRRQVWVGTQPMETTGDNQHLDDLIRIGCGADHVLYGSNWPAADYDTPGRMAARLLNDETRQKVLGQNALDLFGLAVPGESRAVTA